MVRYYCARKQRMLSVEWMNGEECIGCIGEPKCNALREVTDDEFWEWHIREAATFIADKVRESHTDGVVLGISGGVDSAVVLGLCIKALGKEKIHLINLPMDATDKDWSYIEELMKAYDMPVRIVHITNAVNGVMASAQGAFSGLPESQQKLVIGNIHARIRMVELYMFANTWNCLVLGTTNKTEMKIGYFTKHGDGACDIEPISHLYKTEVWEIARRLGVPESIIKKSPTAGLWDGQTDEGEIGMSYAELDKILIEDKTRDYPALESRIMRNWHKKKMPPGLFD
jgi:NAD+ synthase